MRKLFALFTLVLASISLAGCGNHDVGYGSFSFHQAHVQMYGMTEPVHLHVKSWKDDEGGVELRVTFNNKETSILLGDGTYMLYDNEVCPLCGNVKYQ